MDMGDKTHRTARELWQWKRLRFRGRGICGDLEQVRRGVGELCTYVLSDSPWVVTLVPQYECGPRSEEIDQSKHLEGCVLHE